MSNFSYNGKFMIWGILFLLTGYQTRAFSGKYPIQNFTPTDYKAGIQNIDFAQNRDMTLFVANNLGVLSFNGYEWKAHDFKTGKKKRSLAFDEQTSRLYMGSQGEFGFFEADWQYVSLIDRIPMEARDFDEVWDVFLADSQVYFCTFQGIYIYDGQSITVLEPEGAFERSFYAAGKIFTQNQNGRLFEIKGRQLVSNYPQEHSGNVIAGVIPQDEGFLLLYNSGEIEWTSPFGVNRKYEDLIQELSGTYVNHVLQLSDNRLAISTQRSGLILYDLQKGIIEKITTEEGLAGNACLRAFQDYFGNLWVGMQNGIALIHINSPMRLISREINIQGSGYEAFETPVGTYFTTSNGIYFQAKDALQSTFLPGTEGPAYGITEVAGRYYAGHHTGLFLLEEEKGVRVATTDGLWQVRQLRSQPDYAIAGTYSGLYLFKIMQDTRYLQPLGKISGFNDSSRFIEEDGQGNLWVGQYYKGLYKLNLSEDLKAVEVEDRSEDSNLPIKEQIVLSKVKDVLYVATNAGLYQLQPADGTLEAATLFAEQMGQQPVYLLAEDKKNNVHVIAENMAAYYKPVSAGNYQFVPSSLYQLRYHLNNDLMQVSVNIDRGVLFSANDGFIQYDPTLEDPLKDEGPLLISKVFSVGQNKALYLRQPFTEKPEMIKPLEVRAKDRVLKVEVESFQFNSLGSQQFRYFLKGLDEGYGEWTNIAIKEYSNLREGTYEFRVQTRDQMGQIVTSRPLFLDVKPPFYVSAIAKVIYLLIGLTGLYQLYAFQRRRYKRKAAKIEEKRQFELAREQQKLAEIKQKKEEELQQLKEEKMQSELQHVNNLLAASTMNLVVKNEFIEAIREELKEVKQKGKNIETKQALERIVKEIDITLKLQEDWEQFEYHFDAVHGDFLTRLRNDFPDLSPNEQKLCAFLRLNLNTKEITNLLGISIRGVEVARYRLRKKLDLETGQNLSKFILEY